MADLVTLYNAETGEAWPCPAQAVEFWTKNGYRKTNPQKSGSSAGSSSSKES